MQDFHLAKIHGKDPSLDSSKRDAKEEDNDEDEGKGPADKETGPEDKGKGLA